MNSKEKIIFKALDSIKKDNISTSKKDLIIIDDCNDKSRAGWDKIKSFQNRNYVNKKDINKWSYRDLYYYYQDMFKAIYGYANQYQLGIALASNEIIFIEDAMSKISGLNIGPKQIKSYIDWFFENVAEKYIRKEGDGIHVSKLKNYDNIEKFVSFSINKLEVKNFDSIDKLFVVNRYDAMCEYGIVNLSNWLTESKKYNKKKVENFIINTIKNINDQKMINKLIENTNSFSPYKNSSEIKDFSFLKDVVSYYDKFNIKFLKGD